MPPPHETTPLLRDSIAEQQHHQHTASSASPLLNGQGTNGNNDPEQQQSEADAAPVQDPDVPTIPGVSVKYIVPAMAVGIFLAAMDNTIVVASYGRIGTEMDALDRTSWISTGYLLTITACQPLYGKLSDIFGRKACLLFAYAIFGIGCLLCGMSQSMGQLIFARAFAGIGGGGMTTVSSILMSDIVPLRKRGTWQGILNIIFASGSAIGGPLGGYLADTVGWRWAFLGQFPMTILAITTVTFALHLPPTLEIAGSTLKTRLFRVDFPGAFTLVTAIFFLLIALDQGTTTAALSPPLVATLLSISLFLWITFIYIESYLAKEPFCPPSLVKRVYILAPCLANFFSFNAFMTILFLFPLYNQAVLNTSAAIAGKRLLPAILGGVSGSLAGGIYMQKTGKYYTLTVLSYFTVFLGCILVTFIVYSPQYTLTTRVYGLGTSITIIGVGNGIGVTSTLIALISNVSGKDQAVVTAVSYLFRSLGMVLGVSIGSGVVQSGLGRKLHRELDGTVGDVDEIVRRVRTGLDYLGELPEGVEGVVRRCYGEAIGEAFVYAAVCGAGAWVASMWLREVRVKK